MLALKLKKKVLFLFLLPIHVELPGESHSSMCISFNANTFGTS